MKWYTYYKLFKKKTGRITAMMNNFIVELKTKFNYTLLDDRYKTQTNNKL